MGLSPNQRDFFRNSEPVKEARLGTTGRWRARCEPKIAVCRNVALAAVMVWHFPLLSACSAENTDNVSTHPGGEGSCGDHRHCQPPHRAHDLHGHSVHETVTIFVPLTRPTAKTLPPPGVSNTGASIFSRISSGPRFKRSSRALSKWWICTRMWLTANRIGM